MMFAVSRFFVIILCLNLFIASQAHCKTQKQNEGNDDPISKELEAYAANKEIPDKLQEVILTALSFYPELIDTPIEFVLKDDIKKSVMQAQPKIKSIFKKKSSRKYIIKISKELKLVHDNQDISTLPCEVLVGWIAHELGHVMDYKDRSSFSMIKFGFHYVLSKNFVIKAEKRADLYALEHGLGHNIIETKNFVLTHDDIPQEYKARNKRLYMSPDEFEQMIGSATP